MKFRVPICILQSSDVQYLEVDRHRNDFLIDNICYHVRTEFIRGEEGPHPRPHMSDILICSKCIEVYIFLSKCQPPPGQFPRPPHGGDGPRPDSGLLQGRDQEDLPPRRRRAGLAPGHVGPTPAGPYSIWTELKAGEGVADTKACMSK